ncbi:SDR family oxidoreductase [Candidatus Pelagibacter sp.]|nr:SDR family oxidoreductase [Candidatus Pelagibacter sp.]
MEKLVKKTIIFGSSGDIGKEIKKSLYKHDVLEINSKQLNLKNLNSVKKFKFKSIPDNLIFVSAINYPKFFLKLKTKEIEDTLNINLISFIYIIQNLLKISQKHKKKIKIVIITSLYSKFGRSKRFLYSVSKHALLGMVRNLAVELGPYGVIVNAVSPGYVDTKMTRKNLKNDQINFLKNKTPLKKLVSTKDVANVVKILIDNNHSITGQEIIVDGGISVNGSFGL